MNRRRPDVDVQKMRRYRQSRIREQMRRYDYDACILFDAVNIRYASGARNMQVFTSRNPAARYLFVPAEGDVVLFEFPGCAHLAQGACVDEVRPATTVSYVAAADRLNEQCKKWADEMDSLLQQTLGSGKKRLGVEAAHHQHAIAMQQRGYEILDAQRITELARMKNHRKNYSAFVILYARLKPVSPKCANTIRPGMTENQLWSLLHQAIIAAGGDYIETRLLSSGARTNPWFQECSDKTLSNGELVDWIPMLSAPSVITPISPAPFMSARVAHRQRDKKRFTNLPMSKFITIWICCGRVLVLGK